VHLTDEQSPALDGADEVIRRPRERMARLRMQHQANLTGEWLFLDADVLIQEDVRRVFDRPFDVAIADREWPHLKPAGGFTEAMPYNSGVMFSRCPRFWVEAYELLTALPKPEQTWMGDQMVICELIASRRFTVVELSGARYNFPPAVDPNDDLRLSAALEASAAIVHFKGPQRKPLMLSRIGEALPCV